MRQLRLALGALIAVAITAPALAQSYPARSIRLVVPFGAGGRTDNLARIVEPLVSKALGQPIIIDNRPGGGSVIGTEAVAKSLIDSPDHKGNLLGEFTRIGVGYATNAEGTPSWCLILGVPAPRK